MCDDGVCRFDVRTVHVRLSSLELDCFGVDVLFLQCLLKVVFEFV
jgi:hypothetical protein